MPADVRLIAFYLPQFHPIPENDDWWGQGFTEWTNVRRATALFDGHAQPRRPAELGYYDLREREVRHHQAEIARRYGIYGFCYYYYWFSGKRLLEQPLDLMLSDRELDFPFCICWANETWSRRWDGSETDTLIEQKYQAGDPAQFVRDIAPILRDARYITVGGAPILLVYRAAEIPDLRGVVRAWRETARSLGLPGLHLCAVQSNNYTSGLDDGFDAMVEFPPHSLPVGPRSDALPGMVPGFAGKVFSYTDVVQHCARLGSATGLPIYRGLMPGWDNTPRRGLHSYIFHEATPELYEVWLRRLIDHAHQNHPADRRFVFINAWNEWAEGAYLEPDEAYGYSYLEATARAVLGVASASTLLTALRQVTEGNAEASSLLTELAQAIAVKDRTLDLVTAGGLLADGAARDGFRAAFRPVEGSSFEVPPKTSTDDVVGFADAVGTPNYGQTVSLNRAYDVLVQGWIASRRIGTHPNAPIIFRLTNLESGRIFVARVLSRVRRDDVVAHLKSQRAYRSLSDDHLLYSGYRAYLTIAAIAPGPYRLDAILPADDGRTGVRVSVHDSIAVL